MAFRRFFSLIWNANLLGIFFYYSRQSRFCEIPISIMPFIITLFETLLRMRNTQLDWVICAPGRIGACLIKPHHQVLLYCMGRSCGPRKFCQRLNTSVGCCVWMFSLLKQDYYRKISIEIYFFYVVMLKNLLIVHF